MPCSTLVHLLVSSISHSSEHIKFPPSAQHKHGRFVPVVSQNVSIPVTNLPARYSDFSDVFEKRNVDRLPAHRPYDCPIELQEGTHPPFGPIYGLSDPELEALCMYLDENLAMGFIQPYKSSDGAQILFFKKKDGSLHLCVDYRGLRI